MQTFLPYPDFTQSAACLDWRRLGKQCTEVQQILDALFGVSRGWRRHTATRMWRGHELSLARYGLTCCAEWRSRGYEQRFDEIMIEVMIGVVEEQSHRSEPLWLGDERLHASHRSNLLRKDPDYYAQFGWAEPDDLPYWWPE